MRAWGVALAVLACAFAAAPAARAADDPPRVVGQERLSPRLTEYTMATPALAAPTKVRVLLPDGYADRPDRRYPVLLLLHGAFDDFRSWTAKGDAERITAGAPVIVVMPDGGQGGWYTDWYHHGRGGPPQWERFHLEQLLPWVDATFRTAGRREGRAVAGLSMGGFGAMSYAARHPDRFVFAASFSGAVDIVNNAPVAAVIALEAGAEGTAPGAQFGDRVADEIRWRAHNPTDLAENLRGMTLSLASGDGRRGPLDDPAGPPDPIENQTGAMTDSLHRRLADLQIAHTYDAYGPGTHTWPYWQRELREVLPAMLSAFGQAPPTAPFTFVAAEPAYAIHGWSVAFADPTYAFSRLADAGRAGFALTGHGRVAVTTPPVYGAGSVADAVVRVGAGRPSTRTVRADEAGRLRLTLDLGGRRGPLAPATARVAIHEAAAAGLPPSTGPRACTSRRRFSVRVVRRRGMRVGSVEVRVGGRRTLLRHGAVRRVAVDLRGLPAGVHRVEIIVRGRRSSRPVKLTARRAYRTCVRPRPH